MSGFPVLTLLTVLPLIGAAIALFAGKHARAAVGVNNLPLNASVEVDAIFALKKKLS